MIFAIRSTPPQEHQRCPSLSLLPLVDGFSRRVIMAAATDHVRRTPRLASFISFVKPIHLRIPPLL